MGRIAGGGRMTEKELEQQSEEFKKGFSVGYEDGKQNERKLQLGKTNLLRDVERLEKENEQLKQQIEKMKCCNNCKLYQCEKWKNNEINYHFNKCENWEFVE